MYPFVSLLRVVVYSHDVVILLKIYVNNVILQIKLTTGSYN